MCAPCLWLCSVDLVQCSGFEGAPCSLNEDLVSAVQVLAAAMQKWGVMPTLDFVRGGRTGALRLICDRVSEGTRGRIACIRSQWDGQLGRG